MCTVIISVPSSDAGSVRILAVRDEDPARPWDRLGEWWPESHPGVIGIRDARAGGAWLAADPQARRLAVLLNRIDLSGRPDSAVRTRGSLALEAVRGREPAEQPATRGFNLVEIDAHTARVVSWDGRVRRETALGPGIHMIAHDDVDDAGTPRITRWLDEFRAAGAGDDRRDAEPWWSGWRDVLARSARLPGDDDRAIIRRQEFEGIPSYSLVVAVAEMGADRCEVRDAPLVDPGTWNPLEPASPDGFA